jgi:hypothetical protein
MEEGSGWMQILLLIVSVIGLITTCCTPVMTALANVIVFAGFKIIRDKISTNDAGGTSITSDSTLVCHFRPSDNPV